MNKRKLINYSFLVGSGVGVGCLRGGGEGGGGGGVVVEEVWRENRRLYQKPTKSAESRGFRGAVIMPKSGGKETGSGEGMAGLVALWIGGVSWLRWASGGRERDSP